MSVTSVDSYARAEDPFPQLRNHQPLRHAQSQPLHIVLAAPPYFDVPPKAYGGVEAVVAELAEALVARGHKVTLLGAGDPRTSAEFVPLWDRAIPERLGDPYPEVVHALLIRRAVERLLAAGGVDIVHDHTFAGPLNAMYYSQWDVPTIVTVHGPIDADLEQYYRALQAEVHLVAISNRQRTFAPELNWAGTVHNALCVDDWPYQPAKEEYALFLGRFHPHKAPHLALEAAHAADLPLILAGKCAEPAEKDYFEREVRPRMTARDHMVGVADATAKRALLASARCLLFPVRWEEPFGMVMIEAMACGTPVVALRAGAVPEVVVDKVTGLICDEPAELGDAVREVGSIEPAACRSHVAKRFNVDQLGAGYEAVYWSVLQRQAGNARTRRAHNGFALQAPRGVA